MNILIIYENVPEQTKIYMLGGQDRETLAQLSLCHNHFANLSGNSEEQDSALFWLSEKLYGEWKENLVYDSNKESNVIKAYGSGEDAIIYVIHTGIIL